MKKALQRSKTFDGELFKAEKRLTRQPTVSSFHYTAEFDYKRDVKQLVKLIKQCLTAHIFDLDAILHFLSAYNCERRMLLIHDLEFEHQYNLVDMVLDQPPSPIRSCTLAMLVEPVELAVRDFHGALSLKLSGRLPDDISRLLLEILLGLSNDDMTKFCETYEQLFVNVVQKDIQLAFGEASIVSRVLVDLLEGQRYPDSATSITSAKAVAKCFAETPSDTPTLDDDTLVKVFTRESFSQLSSIFEIYEDKYKESILPAIKRHFGEPIGVQCLHDIVEFTHSPSGYYSRLLRQALDKTPIDYVTLARIIIGREEKELPEIKLEYSKMHDETLDKTLVQRLENFEVKRLLVMITTNGRDIATDEDGPVRFYHSNNSHTTGSGGHSTTSTGVSAAGRRLSHEAYEKVVHMFKLKRPH